jgi:hypothetical protein
MAANGRPVATAGRAAKRAGRRASWPTRTSTRWSWA